MWRRIEALDLPDLDDLIALLEICPGAANLVMELSIRVPWKSFVFGDQWWKPRVCSDATEWIYADRRDELERAYGEFY